MLTIGGGDDDLLEHRDWIAKETLAVSVEVGSSPSRRSASPDPGTVAVPSQPPD